MPDRYVWSPADGSPDIDLTDWSSGYQVMATGTTGMRSVAYSLTSQQFAGVDGAQVQAIQAAPNTPTLAMTLQGPTRELYQARARGLVHAMRPKAGPGTLTVTSVDGTKRSLTCYVTGGLEGDKAPGHDQWWNFVLKLYAPSPWWEGSPATVDFGLAAPSVFLSPTLPFPRMLAASTIQGQQTIDLSSSDAPSFPVWTVTGPGSFLTLTNQTTGRSIQVNAAIGDGQTMVIDTRPGFQSVRAGDGTNLMGTLQSDPALWPLVEGVNVVSAVLGSAGPAARISGVYSPRFAGI